MSVLFICCSDEDLSGEVSVDSHQTSFTIKNGLNETIYYFAADQTALAYIDWAPTLAEEIAIRSGKEKEISHDDVHYNIDSLNSPIIVYWWKAEKMDGVLAPGEIQFIYVPKLMNKP